MNVLQFAVLGLGSGAIYAIIAQGQILIYRGSGILNFAQGAFVMMGAYVYYELHEHHHWAFAPALITSMAACAFVSASVHVLIIRHMKSASALPRVMVTLGVMVVIESIGVLIYGDQVDSVRSTLPTKNMRLLSGVYVGIDVLYLVGIGAVLTGALWFTFKYTGFGRITAAVAENLQAAVVTGHSPDAIAVVNWAIGGALAAFAGALIAPITFLQVDNLVLLVVPALAAGLIGSFRSFPIAFAGGLGIGVAESLVGRYVSTPGWNDAVPLLVIIGLLMIRGRGAPLRSFIYDRMPSVASARVPVIPSILLIGAALIFTFFATTPWVVALNVTVLLGVICLSVVVVSGYAGQLSLAQYVLGGLAALVAARLDADWHFPFLLAMTGAVLATTAVGIVVAIPSFRARGVTLAIATLGLSTVIYNIVLNNYSWSGGTSGIGVQPPTLFGWSIDPALHASRYGAVCIIAASAISLMVSNVRRGSSGRRMLAVRSNERASAALGVNVYGAKIYAFALAAAIAGVGGVLLAFLQPYVVPQTFDIKSSINVLTVVVVAGVGSIAGGFVAAVLIPGGLLSQAFLSTPLISRWLPLFGGVSLLFVLRTAPSGVVEMHRGQFEDLVGWVRRRGRSQQTSAVDAFVETDETLQASGASDLPSPSKMPVKRLVLHNIGVRFGGVEALKNVSLELRPGEVHGLIGPNGAGKTTLIDAVTGFVPLTSGDIELDGVSIAAMSPQHRARVGISRSFQSLELFADLTVRENLAIAAERDGSHCYLTDLFWPRRLQLDPLVLSVVRWLNLEKCLDAKAESLPFGQRRLVAVARALSAGPSVLLLDEPMSGLSDEESQELAVVIRSMAEEMGLAVLLVEHNLDVVMGISDTVTVLALGALLSQGSPREVRADPSVIEAYVGQDIEGDRRPRQAAGLT